MRLLIFSFPLFCNSACVLHLALLLRKFAFILLIPHLHHSLLHWPPSSCTVSFFFPQTFFTPMSYFPLTFSSWNYSYALSLCAYKDKTNSPENHRFALLLFNFLIFNLFKKTPEFFFFFFFTTTAYSKSVVVGFFRLFFKPTIRQYEKFTKNLNIALFTVFPEKKWFKMFLHLDKNILKDIELKLLLYLKNILLMGNG